MELIRAPLPLQPRILVKESVVLVKRKYGLTQRSCSSFSSVFYPKHGFSKASGRTDGVFGEYFPPPQGSLNCVGGVCELLFLPLPCENKEKGEFSKTLQRECPRQPSNLPPLFGPDVLKIRDGPTTTTTIFEFISRLPIFQFGYHWMSYQMPLLHSGTQRTHKDFHLMCYQAPL